MYLIIIVIVAIVIFYKFPGIFPKSWRVRSGQEAVSHIFRLEPEEKILHQSSGIFDPNAHLDTSESLVKNIGLGMVGKQLTHWQNISFVLTDRNRFIISHDPRVEPISFDKKNLPKIIDTGRKPKKMSPIPEMYRYPGTSGQARIVEIDAPEIPDCLIPENTGKFEISTPVEFISILMEWQKKNEAKEEF